MKRKSPCLELCDQNKKAEAYSWKKQFIDIIDLFVHGVKKKAKKIKVKNKWREKAPAIELCGQNKKAEAYSWKKQFVDIIDLFVHGVKRKMRWIMASI